MPTTPATRLTSCTALRLWRKLRTKPASVTTPSLTATAISVGSMSASDRSSTSTSRLMSKSVRMAVSPSCGTGTWVFGPGDLTDRHCMRPSYRRIDNHQPERNRIRILAQPSLTPRDSYIRYPVVGDGRQDDEFLSLPRCRLRYFSPPRRLAPMEYP